jgi:hypothetical protein
MWKVYRWLVKKTYGTNRYIAFFRDGIGFPFLDFALVFRRCKKYRGLGIFKNHDIFSSMGEVYVLFFKWSFSFYPTYCNIEMKVPTKKEVVKKRIKKLRKWNWLFSKQS